MDGRDSVGLPKDDGDYIGGSTGSRDCIRHSTEGRDFVEA